MRRVLFFLTWVCAAAACARGQSIAWDPPGGSIAVGQSIALRLVCRDCEPTSAPTPPKVPDLQIYYQGPSTSLINDNGVVSQTFAYTFFVLWSKKEVLEIPAFDVPTNHGTIRVPAARFEPTEATVGNSGKPLSAAANARLIVHPTTVWAGQVVQLEYRIQAEASYRPDFAHQPPTWNPDTLVAEEWSRPEAFESHSGGDNLSGFTYRTRVVAPRAGTYELHPVSQLVNLSVGLAMFGFFQSPQFQQYSVPSPPVTLQVRELPPPPPGFTGAVGNFTLTSKVVPLATGVREPITWTLELSGTGNWPQINRLPVRTASRDFEVVHPQLQHSAVPGKIFDAKLSEDVVLVPTKPGRYVLPPVNFVYFDPVAGEYRTISSAESAVDIAAPPGGISPVAPVEAAWAPPLAAVPALPGALPRDPLPTGGRAWLPLAADEWIFGGLLVPVAVLILVWLALARQRAQWTDPLRPRREARLRLGRYLEQITRESKNGSAPVSRSLLLNWQSDAARWRAAPAAVPVPEALGDPTWVQLAVEVDRALYGPTGLLPSDWSIRAGQALAAQPPPRFRSAALFLPRNLLPFFVWAAILAAADTRAGAAPPLADYQSGRFAAAERGWRELSPLDSAARHDLSLALAQQNRWPEAAGNAAAAFVQDPSNPVIRAQFLTACERAGVSPGPLAEFLSSASWLRWAETFSAGGWQRCSIAAAVLALLGVALALVASYGVGPRPLLKTLASLALLIGLAGTAAGIAGYFAYGAARHPSAVWIVRAGSLRSIPTEADAAQATVPLAAGSIAPIDKSFLGWVRLRFPNGTTGWVRRSEVISLWQ